MLRKIAHITDLHLDEKFPIEFGVHARDNWKILLDDVADKKITDVVFTGDIGTYDSNQWFFNSIKDYNLDFRITLGNHDLFSEVIKYYSFTQTEGRAELYYNHEDEYYKYIYLDSSLAQLNDDQFYWLSNALNTDKKIILFIHHPILDTGTTPQKEYPLQGHNKIKDALLTAKSAVHIFCGHLHLEDLQEEKNITQIVTPAACYQIKKQSKTTEGDNINFGYRIIEVKQDEISTELVMLQRN